MGSSIALVGLAATLLSFGAGATLSGMARQPVYVPPLSLAPLRVMSFNIRVATDSDGDNNWPHRKDMAAATIRFHQADLVGVQEAYVSMTADLEQRLPGYRQVGVGTSDGRSEGACNPIFWRDSRLELLHWDTRWFSPTPDKPGIGWDAAFPRNVTRATFRDRESRSDLHVLNLHLDHEGAEARLHSARMLATMVNTLPADARVIVLGDFNCDDAEPPIAALTQSSRLRDARHISRTGHYGPTGTYTGFAGPQFTGPLLDHIFVLNLAVQQHGILPDHFDGRLPSDHFPVLAELTLDP